MLEDIMSWIHPQTLRETALNVWLGVGILFTLIGSIGLLRDYGASHGLVALGGFLLLGPALYILKPADLVVQRDADRADLVKRIDAAEDARLKADSARRAAERLRDSEINRSVSVGEQLKVQQRVHQACAAKLAVAAGSRDSCLSTVRTHVTELNALRASERQLREEVARYTSQSKLEAWNSRRSTIALYQSRMALEAERVLRATSDERAWINKQTINFLTIQRTLSTVAIERIEASPPPSLPAPDCAVGELSGTWASIRIAPKPLPIELGVQPTATYEVVMLDGGSQFKFQPGTFDLGVRETTFEAVAKQLRDILAERRVAQECLILVLRGQGYGPPGDLRNTTGSLRELPPKYRDFSTFSVLFGADPLPIDAEIDRKPEIRTINNNDLPDLRAHYIRSRVRTVNDRLQIRVVSAMPSAQAAKTKTGFEAYLVVRSARAALKGR